jgi:hypothetical protein
MSLVGTVQYIAAVSSYRPGIAYVASVLARYLACPTSHSMNCAKRLVRYLEATKNLVLRYDCSGEHMDQLVAYSDADFAGCNETSKSTSAMGSLYCGQPVC